MSGIAAFVRADGEDPAPGLAPHGVETLSWRGEVAAAAVFAEGPVVLVHVPACFAEFEGGQPVTSDASPWVVVLDGRLDHRADLVAALGLPVTAGDECTDGDLVLRAITAWGSDAVRRLEGDFAFLAWHRKDRRLLAGRDALGLRPLFHARAGDLLIVGSDPRLAHGPAGLPVAVDDGVFGEMLVDQLMTPENSLYRGVRRILPGYSLVTEGGQLHLEPGWNLDPTRLSAVTDPDEAAERVRAVLDEAVASRLRSGHVVGCELSGGMDSTSIAVSAVASAGAGRVRAYGLAFPGMPCDEADRIREVIEHAGLDARVVEHRGPREDSAAMPMPAHGGRPPNPCFNAWAPLQARARADGVRAMLCGYGGDEWLDSTPYDLSDRIRRLGWIRAVRESRAETASLRKHGSNLLRYGLAPRLPEGWIRRLDALRGRSAVPRWIRPEYARRIDLEDRIRDRTRWDRYATYAQAAVWEETRTGFWSDSWENTDREAHVLGVEVRQPFLDRRLIETCMALPNELHRIDGISKSILRRAMRGRLPESVRTTRSKPAHTPVVIETLAPMIRAGAWSRLALEEAGMVDGSRLTEQARAAGRIWHEHPSGQAAVAQALWTVHALDRWWKARR